MENVGIIGQRPDFIGGLPVGYVGSTGIYNGYTMSGGDDFLGKLNIVNVNAPLAKYFTTHVYAPGARSVFGALHQSYDMDPYHTGSQDSNRGIPVGSTNLNQANSILNLQVRQANSGETPYINQKPLLGSMIHTGGYVAVSPPCIIEASVALSTATPPGGWHPTFWVLNANPTNNPQAGTPGWLEFDFPECFGGNPEANTNVHGTPGGSWTSDSTGPLTGVMGVGFVTFSLVITSSSVLFYQNGTLVKTESHNGCITGNPYYLLFTSHTYDSPLGNVNLSQWAAAGTTGATMQVDWFRAWIPTTAPTIITPLEQLPTLQVNYNTSMTYTFPSLASLYGAGFSGSDYCCGIKKEDFEPGCQAEGSGGYQQQFPSGLSWNSGTRVLTGITSDKRPGRMHVTSVPYLSTGAYGIQPRGYIDVGPLISATDFVLVNGVATTIDLYQVCDCGDLVPNVITCTGLPSGLSFNASTGLITVSSTVSNGTTPITIGVTNSSGQTASKTVNCIIQSSADSLALDGTASTASGYTVTLSTTNARDIICLIIYNAASPYFTQYVTDTAGLVWQRRNIGFDNAGNWSLDLWYARANSPLSSNVITATGVSGGRLEAFGIHGANMINPWDTNSSLPIVPVIGTTATSASAVISTTNASTMVLAAIRSFASLGTITEPSGFTQVTTTGADEDISYMINSSALSSSTITYSWTGTTTQSVMLVDAIQGQA
jgi:hypothetical protein